MVTLYCPPTRQMPPRKSFQKLYQCHLKTSPSGTCPDLSILLFHFLPAALVAPSMFKHPLCGLLLNGHRACSPIPFKPGSFLSYIQKARFVTPHGIPNPVLSFYTQNAEFHYSLAKFKAELYRLAKSPEHLTTNGKDRHVLNE